MKIIIFCYKIFKDFGIYHNFNLYGFVKHQLEAWKSLLFHVSSFYEENFLKLNTLLT